MMKVMMMVKMNMMVDRRVYVDVFGNGVKKEQVHSSG